MAFWMLPNTRRPSLTVRTMDAKSSSTNTTAQPAGAGPAPPPAVGLQRVDRVQFLPGHDPGEDGGRPDAPPQLGVVHRVQFGPSDGHAVPRQADLAGDRPRPAPAPPR